MLENQKLRYDIHLLTAVGLILFQNFYRRSVLVGFKRKMWFKLRFRFS